MERRTSPDDIDRINQALDLAGAALEPFTPGDISSRLKAGDDPVTAADLAVNDVLLEALPQSDEGWLSEETGDDAERLKHSRVWVVDPVDGTREFIMGIPEWCVSIGLVVDGVPVAGGILSPSAGHRMVGSIDDGVTLNGAPAAMSPKTDLQGAQVLASRSEVKRGEWEPFFSTPISVRNMGSVAYKLGLVAVGLAEATWTLVPKNEWDVAAGAALVLAGGGAIFGPDGEEVTFNRENPLMPGFVATSGPLEQPVRELIKPFRT